MDDRTIESGYERNDGLLSSPRAWLTVPLPSYRLSPNGTRHRMERHSLAQAARTDANLVARGLFPGARQPFFPPGRVVTLRVVVTTAKGQRRLDDDGLIGLLKSTVDGLQGPLIHDDRQIVWTGITWERGTGRGGTVRLELTGT